MRAEQSSSERRADRRAPAGGRRSRRAETGRVGRVAARRARSSRSVSPDIAVAQDGDADRVSRPTDRADHRALHGLMRTLVANMVEGVTNGLREAPRDPGRRLPCHARRAATSSSPSATRTRHGEAPEGHRVRGAAPTRVIVRGIDKQAVGQVAAKIRELRPPEPYKGKGIRYAGRARPAQGRQAGVASDAGTMSRTTQAGSAPSRRHRRVRGKVRGHARAPRLAVFRSNRSDLRAAHRRRPGHTRSRPPTRPRPRGRRRRERACQGGGQAARRAGEGRRRRDGRVRPRRLPVPRSREGARRRRPRGRTASSRWATDSGASGTAASSRSAWSRSTAWRRSSRAAAASPSPRWWWSATRSTRSASATARRRRSRSPSRRRSRTRRRTCSRCRST